MRPDLPFRPGFGTRTVPQVRTASLRVILLDLVLTILAVMAVFAICVAAGIP